MKQTVFVAGHNGFVGKSLCKLLQNNNYKVITRSHNELDLTNQAAVNAFFQKELPEIVIVAAAKVGGINANQLFPVEFLNENLLISSNVITAAANYNAKKLVYLASACIYPRITEQPIKPNTLLTGSLEPTNEAYALAKIAGIKLCQFYKKQYNKNFISVVPANLYGPNDHFNSELAHVIPSLISRFHKAKINNEPEVSIWGSGTAVRDFLYIDDFTQALLLSIQQYDDIELLNIGTGIGTSISELANALHHIIQFKGKVNFDTTKPDGMPKKVLDCEILHKMGWKPTFDIFNGLRATYENYLENH